MKNRYLAALQEAPNIVGIAGAVALSAALLTPIPLLAAIVAEAAYLIFVPDSKWYEKRLAKIHDAEIFERRQQLKEQVFPLLSVDLRKRFDRMVIGREEIAHQAKTDQKWLAHIVRKLDFLLEKWLQFAQKEAQFRAYLETVAREHGGRIRSFKSGQGAALYENELSHIEHLLGQEEDTGTKAVLEKRLEVTRRRQNFAEKLVKTIDNLNHQLELLEDTFSLIREELLARSPEQVLGEIDDVVSQTNTMTQVLEEMAPYERMLANVD
jgi:hypothetical protein